MAHALGVAHDRHLTKCVPHLAAPCPLTLTHNTNQQVGMYNDTQPDAGFTVKINGQLTT